MSAPDSEYNPDATVRPDVQEYGDISEPSGVDNRNEDREAADSERTGTIPKREVDEIRSGAEVIDQRTRGVKTDAYKQERAVDEALVRDDIIESAEEET